MNKSIIAEYIQINLEHYGNYHNYKENMSNAGFLVQLTLFGSIVSEGLWPPSWVEEMFSMPKIMTFLVYFLLWFLIHYYTRWQLINKRVAAFYVSGYMRAHQKIIVTEGDVDITPYAKKLNKSSKWKNFFSKIVFIPGGFTKMDVDIQGIPSFVAKEIESAFSKGSGAETLEVLITYTSILLMTIVSIKIFT